ncbi:hypothetical protein DDT91_12015 [Algoriphagus sp. AK58]|nr:hypothetical protein [Algoriphagus sp. AK58]
MKAVKIFILEHEIPQADRIKILLESSGYDVTWTILSKKETQKTLSQNINTCKVLSVEVDGNQKVKGILDIPKTAHQEGVLPCKSTPLKGVIDGEYNPFGSTAKEKDLESDEPDNTRKVFSSSKTKQGFFPTGIQSSHSFIFEDSFFIRSNSALVKLKFEDIIYLEADANYTQIFTSGKKYSIRASLKELEEKIKDKRFARVHKSFLINLEKIESIHAESIQIDNREIPIGRQQYRWLLSQIKIL